LRILNISRRTGGRLLVWKTHLQRLTLDFQQWDESAQESGESKGNGPSQLGNKKAGKLTFAVAKHTTTSSEAAHEKRESVSR
jgi:hypothetical protein